MEYRIIFKYEDELDFIVYADSDDEAKEKAFEKFRKRHPASDIVDTTIIAND
jgi:hypothetical protein